MSTLKQKDSPIAILDRFAKFLYKFNKLNEKPTFWNAIKQMYYIKFEYKRMTKNNTKSFKKNLEFAYQHHEYTSDIITRFIVALVGWSGRDQDKLQEILDKATKSNGVIKIFFNQDENNENLLVGYRIVVEGVSYEKEFYQNKHVRMKLSYDIPRAQFNVNIELRNLDSDGNPLPNPYKIKNLCVAPSGELSNSNYILDSELYKEDYIDFCFSIILTLIPLCKSISYITTCKFEPIKKLK